VRERLTREIAHWDHRANQLADQEASGRQPRMNAQQARHRADELAARMQRRFDELDRQARLAPQRPVVVGAALVLPRGWLDTQQPDSGDEPMRHAKETKRVERLAVDAVLAIEERRGRSPREMPPNNPGYDIETHPGDAPLTFLEVKGRVQGSTEFTVTRQEILTGLNKTDNFILALVEVAPDDSTTVRYLRNPFIGTDDLYFGVASVDFKWRVHWDRAQEPE
jgi:hypothetical protein